MRSFDLRLGVGTDVILLGLMFGTKNWRLALHLKIRLVAWRAFVDRQGLYHDSAD